MQDRFGQDEPEAREANRRGQLTPLQHARLQFLLDAELLAVGIQLLTGFLLTSLFSCVIAGVWVQHGSMNDIEVFAPFVALGALLLWQAGRRLGRLARYRTELNREHIVQTDGRIEWKRRSYRLKLPGGLHAPINFVMRPGAFRFYYIPYSSGVLFVEPLSAPEESKSMLLGALMRARGFNRQDLGANRRLRVSEYQRRRLRRNFLRALLLKSLAAWAGASALMMAVVNYQIQRGVEYTPTALLAAIPFALVQATLLADLRIQLQDLAAGKVLAVQGTGWLAGSWRVRWHVGEKAFAVNVWSAHALVPGATYRAYSLPRSGYLLSIEPVGK